MMLNGYMTYDEHWDSKGDYGQERIRRKNLRKQKRRDKAKEKGTCKCGINPRTPHLHQCPFSVEINDITTDVCDCCGSCEHECAMDI
jgi:hypothetical protein